MTNIADFDGMTQFIAANLANRKAVSYRSKPFFFFFGFEQFNILFRKTNVTNVFPPTRVFIVTLEKYILISKIIRANGREMH